MRVPVFLAGVSRRSALQRAERGMVAAAFVTTNVEGISVATAQWQRIYEGSGVAVRFFRELEPAKAWLREQIDRRKDARTTGTA